MKNEQSKVFLSKIREKIFNGEFDEYVMPFVSRELIYASIKARIDKKLETGATPILSDTEIKEALKDTKEIAAITYALFLNAGIIEKTDDGPIVSKTITF